MNSYKHSALLTDLYEFTMAYTYFKQNRHEDIAYFDMFVRTIPNQGGYILFNGLNQLIDQINCSPHKPYADAFAAGRAADAGRLAALPPQPDPAGGGWHGHPPVRRPLRHHAA